MGGPESQVGQDLLDDFGLLDERDEESAHEALLGGRSLRKLAEFELLFEMLRHSVKAVYEMTDLAFGNFCRFRCSRVFLAIPLKCT